MKAAGEFNLLWDERDPCTKFMEFHRKTFAKSKARTGFNVQVYACRERAVWKSKGKVKRITVKFNVPRNCNTSSIPIGKLSEAVSDKSRFIGLHFFNPVPVMKPVEVIIGSGTSKNTEQIAMQLISKCGKIPVTVKDYPGFVANSVLMPMLNEAIILLEKGVSTKEGIDTIIKLGLNHPMGPLELADYIGLDVCKDIMDSIYNETKDEKFKPTEMLVKLVSEGKLGRKSGEGFYQYDK